MQTQMLCIRDARYTGTVKVPVSIIFKTVQYHNLILHNSVFHTLLFRSASQIAAKPVNVTTEQVNNTMDQTD